MASPCTFPLRKQHDRITNHGGSTKGTIEDPCTFGMSPEACGESRAREMVRPILIGRPLRFPKKGSGCRLLAGNL
jgi:hypothetical protein